MVRLEKFDWTKVEKELENEKYTLLYLDYDRANGIRLIDSISMLSDRDKSNFYKMIIFNDDFMITVYNLGEESRYSKVEKDDFETPMNVSTGPMIKQYYTTLGKKLAVRVGQTSKGTEIFQFAGFVGGER